MFRVARERLRSKRRRLSWRQGVRSPFEAILRAPLGPEDRRLAGCRPGAFESLESQPYWTPDPQSWGDGPTLDTDCPESEEVVSLLERLEPYLTTHLVFPLGVENEDRRCMRRRVRVLWDVPLPRLVILHDGQHPSRCQNADVERAVPDAIAVSRKTLVTFRFVRWVWVRSLEPMSAATRRRHLFLQYQDSLLFGAVLTTSQCDNILDVVQLLPSNHILQMVDDLAGECFTDLLFYRHRDRFAQLDGAGEKLDTEFKMAARVVRQNPVTGGQQRPWHGTMCVRGARGFFLDDLFLTTRESGERYSSWSRARWARRRRLCVGEVMAGLLDFVCLDNAPAFELWVLATAATVWPEYLITGGVPPTQDIGRLRHSKLLRKDVLRVSSDLWHRVQGIMDEVGTMKPDARELRRDLKYAFGRMHACECNLALDLLPTVRAKGKAPARLRLFLKQWVAGLGWQLCVLKWRQLDALSKLFLQQLLLSAVAQSHRLWIDLFKA